MSKPAEFKQSRRVRKTAYIAAKNKIGNPSPDTAVSYAAPSPTQPLGVVLEQHFVFMHTTRRLAIAGYLASADFIRREAALRRVIGALNVTHPIPAGAVTVLPVGPGALVDPEVRDCLVADEWVAAFEASEVAGNALISELMAGPSPIKSSMFVRGSRLHAAQVYGMVDRASISADDVAEFIVQFRLRGEPLQAGSIWVDPAESVTG
jgi:hypothetical protein